MTTKERMSPNKTARIAGILYLVPWLVLVPTSLFRMNLIVPGDSRATASNIMESESLFRLTVVADLIVQVIFVLLVLLLYRLLKPVNRNQARLMVVLFLVSVPIAMLNELNQFATLLLLSGADYLTMFTTDQLHALLPFFRDMHQHGMMIAYIFWGLWLLPLGYLVFKSGFLPKALGVLVMIGCFGYLIDFVTFFLFPSLDLSVNMVTGYGELLLCLWLLVKGVDVKGWEQRALESARKSPVPAR